MWKTIKHKVELLWQIRESKDMKGRRARMKQKLRLAFVHKRISRNYVHETYQLFNIVARLSLLPFLKLAF